MDCMVKASRSTSPAHEGVARNVLTVHPFAPRTLKKHGQAIATALLSKRQFTRVIA